MCSILKYNNCIGRNFDYEISYNEKLKTIQRDEYGNLYKIIGMVAGIVDDYPLLYDGMNEYGLVCGGLAFSGNAVYGSPKQHLFNIPSYDFVLRILGGFKSVKDVKIKLPTMNITYEAYSEKIQPSDLHWFIGDESESIIVEQTNTGLKWYDGSVMTNNPSFPHQTENLLNHKYLMEAIKLPEMDFGEYATRGMETRGLIGDYTSEGRFVRASYLKENLEKIEDNFEPCVQTFHLLSSVEQVYGTTLVNDKFEYTIYSIVYDMNKLKVYVKFYDDFSVKEKILLK